MLILGMISGTSADGIDAALVETDGRKLHVEKFETVAYPNDVRSRILGASNAQWISVAEISRLNFEVGECFARAARKVIGRRKPALIGSHGQTIFHEGRKSTSQIGEPAVIAARTRITTVGDFRVADVAEGGEGAPLVPYLDYLLCRHKTRSRVALNIGGIANVTLIPAAAKPKDVVAFDTGPGNMVIDALVSHFTKGHMKFDRGGAWARRGQPSPVLLKKLASDSYLRRKPPKTCGREQYGREYVAELLKEKISPEDLLATATVFTVESIVAGIGGPVDDLLVSGGGIHNEFLMSWLRVRLPKTRILRAEDFGIPGDAKEAVLFALLAYQTFHQRPSNIPSATGAKRPAILGKVCYAG